MKKNEKVFILLFNQIRREYPKRLLLTNSYKFHFPLTQTTNFHSRDESRTVSTQIDKITHGAMPRGSTSAWTGEGIPLPALPPSFLFGCNIIDIQYKLEVLRYVHVLEISRSLDKPIYTCIVFINAYLVCRFNNSQKKPSVLYVVSKMQVRTVLCLNISLR